MKITSSRVFHRLYGCCSLLLPPSYNEPPSCFYILLFLPFFLSFFFYSVLSRRSFVFALLEEESRGWIVNCIIVGRTALIENLRLTFLNKQSVQQCFRFSIFRGFWAYLFGDWSNCFDERIKALLLGNSLFWQIKGKEKQKINSSKKTKINSNVLKWLLFLLIC